MALKPAPDTTRAGRIPPCSFPTLGSKSTSQTSPALGSGIGTDLFLLFGRVIRLLMLKPIHRAAFEEGHLVLVRLPGGRIGLKPCVIVTHLSPEAGLPLVLHQLGHDLADCLVLFCRPLPKGGMRLLLHTDCGRCHRLVHSYVSLHEPAGFAHDTPLLPGCTQH